MYPSSRKVIEEHRIEMAEIDTSSTVERQEPDISEITVAETATMVPQEKLTHENEARTSTQLRQPSCDLLPPKNKKMYFKVCVPLRKAALQGDWRTAKRLLDDNCLDDNCELKLTSASITEGCETALHVAAGARQTHFAAELVQLMSPKDLELQDKNGNTAFFHAAAAGTIELAKIMMQKNCALPTIRGSKEVTPLYAAALFGHAKMASFLYDKSKEDLESKDRVGIFLTCLDTGLYDLALELLSQDSELAVVCRVDGKTALHILAEKASAFDNSRSKILPGMKSSENTNLMQSQAFLLVKCLWKKVLKRDDLKAIIREPTHILFDAAKAGNFQFLSELISSYPDLMWDTDIEKQSIFHIAVLHRHASIFNLLYEIGSMKDVITTYEDHMGNNMLHLVAKLPDQNRLNMVSGAALQMQRELLWFKEVEKIMQPSLREKKNKDGQTPHELFTNEHEKLLEKGEEWMKTTAQSCMLVATLIATVVFAAAFSLPGGNDNKKGTPTYLKKTAFKVFAISDAIALSTSSTSILMFLFILISRYSQKDFLKSVPVMLMIGLSTLFISMISMMVAFGTTFCLAYQHGLNLVPAVIFAFASVPAILFVFLQHPLLSDVFYSTYRLRLLFQPSDSVI